MQIVMALVFIVALLGAAYFILGKRDPEFRDRIVAGVGMALAAVAAWFGGLFDKLAN